MTASAPEVLADRGRSLDPEILEFTSRHPKRKKRRKQEPRVHLVRSLSPSSRSLSLVPPSPSSSRISGKGAYAERISSPDPYARSQTATPPYAERISEGVPGTCRISALPYARDISGDRMSGGVGGLVLTRLIALRSSWLTTSLRT